MRHVGSEVRGVIETMLEKDVYKLRCIGIVWACVV